MTRLEEDYRRAGLTSRQVEMLRYVEKLTRTPGDMGDGDVMALQAEGFTDTDVLHIAEVAAYYAYVNRVADGLGVQLER